ncbi:hypothetical protein CYMTET_24477 [Cymbomonas tetramitiformis]|uniref:Sodium/calcium exchanger membrane region domain-containing protein n=1 Tax=Cymbomonas tetramitiformis TaxID=36881 RepID=A0AAE0L086_9CHLO|nr:hypothetical protein CYMTET_24477 [Cymbomonas tetramitiformis]
MQVFASSASAADPPSTPAPHSPLKALRDDAVKLRLTFNQQGPLNVFYLCLPIGIWATRSGYGELGFLASCLAILPLADLMGSTCEDIARHTSPAIGGLVVNTLANMPELMVSYAALKKGLVDVVQVRGGAACWVRSYWYPVVPPAG